VTVHDTAVDGTAAFDANAAAKRAGATPFKRPENAQFQPGFAFGTFVFIPTGDTNADSGHQPELAARGAWGAIFRVDLDCTGETGLLSLVFLGDETHNSFDDVAFADPFTLLVAEDRGDGLHKQLNTLDSIWVFDVFGDPNPRRFVALGRDPASTADAAFGDAGTPGYQNEGDNEPTGLHVSDGDTSIWGMQGTLQNPSRTRWFFTQQHGENRIYEVFGK
jgi:secreted PhoX family phosphatase